MIRILPFAFALACSSSAFGQVALSLDQALDHAQKHNAQNKVRSLEQRAAEKVLWQNIALGLPSVTTAGQYTDNIELPAQFFDINQDGVIDKLQFGTRYTSIGNLSVNQLVFDGSYIVAVLATSVLRDQAALNKEKNRNRGAPASGTTLPPQCDFSRERAGFDREPQASTSNGQPNGSNG